MKYYLISIVVLQMVLFGPDSRGEIRNSHCKIQPVRSDALDWPSRHAWNLFVVLNHPAEHGKIRRGAADCSIPFGTSGRSPVWETWRNANSEVFYASDPPDWHEWNTEAEEKQMRAPMKNLSRVVVQAAEILAEAKLDPAYKADLPFELNLKKLRLMPAFSPDDGVFDVEKGGGFGETRMNRSTYEFIKDQCLYNRQGLERYALAIDTGKKEPINLPIDSIEVKAAWIDFQKEKIHTSKWNSYYSVEHEGKSFGLVSLHIFTKDTPKWFWATFHHIDSPENQWEIPDTYGMPSLVQGTVWENYVLGGTQTDFETVRGEPTILSDHYIEYGFQKSSCITCHATATISAESAPGSIGMPLGELRSLCLLDPNQGPANPAACKRWAGNHLFKAGTDLLLEERGAPLSNWFVEDGQNYHQTDFIFSIPVEGSRVEEIGDTPERCIW